MKISDLSLAELKELVHGLLDDRLRELLGNPDLGLTLGENVRARVKQSLASSERVAGEDVAERLGLLW